MVAKLDYALDAEGSQAESVSVRGEVATRGRSMNARGSSDSH